MKFKLFMVIVAIMLTSNLVEGQTQRDQISFTSYPLAKDSLIIERQNGQKIKLTWPFAKNVKKIADWEQLLADFQTDFKKVMDNIPDYKFYSITYVQKKNLVIDEVRGKEIYTVNEKDEMDYVRSNIAKLRGDKIHLSIEFSDYKELLDPAIKEEVADAVTKIKHVFYISNISAERHYYSVNSASILPKPKPKLKFFVPLGARLGILKNKPYIELRPGVGLIRDKRFYIGLNLNFMTQFDEVSNKTQFDNYLGLTTGSIGAGFGSEVAFKVNSNIPDHEDIFLKAGLHYRTRSGIQIGAEYYLRKLENRNQNQEFLFGFNIGFGF